MKQEMLAKVTKCFVALALTGVFSLELSAQPTDRRQVRPMDWGQVDEIPDGSFLKLESDLTLMPNQFETYVPSWKEEERAAFVRCRFLHSSESYIRVIPATSTFVLENRNVVIQERSVKPHRGNVSKEEVNAKAKVFAADVIGKNFSSPLKLICEGTAYYLEAKDPRFYFVPSFLIESLREALSSRSIDLILPSSDPSTLPRSGTGSGPF